MTLALIAGSGALPVAVAQAYPQARVYALDVTDTPLTAQRFRIETLGTLLADLQAAGVTEVCFAGAVTRPQIDPSKIDAATLPLVPQLMAAAQTRGDDATLRAVLALFEAQGFTIRAAHDLVPDLLPPAGVLAGSLTPEIEDTAARASEVLHLIAPADLGQSCVLRAGQVIAVEAQPGTDWMLESLVPEAQRREMSGDPLSWVIEQFFQRPEPEHPLIAEGGLFFKAPKPTQDRRIDLPAIGPTTVMRAAEAGLAAVVIEARGVMILDRPATIETAQGVGLTLWVRPCASS